MVSIKAHRTLPSETGNICTAHARLDDLSQTREAETKLIKSNHGNNVNGTHGAYSSAQ